MRENQTEIHRRSPGCVSGLTVFKVGSNPHIPLDRILLETDAPFILPYCKDVIQPKLLRRARNTSLILPAVIQKIAELKGISSDEVEQATTENTIRLFHLPIHET